jgi:hypothetical protein
MTDNDNGLGLRQVADVAANHGEVGFSCRKCLGRSGAVVETSRLAIADMALAASPSIEPTATLSVTGRV